MKRTLLLCLFRHDLPAWLLPEYFQLAAIGAIAASAIALWLAKRDGASAVHTTRALACAYLGALAGGYLFESLRALPGAMVAGSWHAVEHPGRAAYGGLLGGAASAALYLWRVQQPQAPFFDRVAVGTGLGFALVRTGCFIAGCDYGLPTALPWAVRFPPGSLAAVDHARHGLVPAGAPSLPVHPTQLYEVLVGLIGAAASTLPLVRGRRDGSAFATFLVIYAVGRFAIEFLRGDQERGHALSLSTAQWVSVALVVGLAIIFLRWPGRLQHYVATGNLTSKRLPVVWRGT
jgi:phosphatidylglycerol:prolipoprotein diacylglycerol transferase